MDHTNPTAKRFTRLWVDAQPTVSAYILSTVRHAADAEDLLHDVAESALEKFDRYDAARSFTGWTLGIARNAVLNHFRTQKRDRHVFGEKALNLLAEAHEASDPHAEAATLALRDCTAALSDDHQRLLELRYRDDMAVTHIAHRKDTTPHAISNSLHRIRQKLAECVRRKLGNEGEADRG